MKKCALVIGHKEIKQGAINEKHQVSEFQFNSKLAQKIYELSKKLNEVTVQIVHREKYADLPGKCNVLRPDFIICLHCNAFNEKASGTEVLYYYKSIRGKQIAQRLQKELLNVLGLYNRGIKATTSQDRGGYILKRTHAPCIISEPFFIDNTEDFERALACYDQMIEAYCQAIQKIALEI